MAKKPLINIKVDEQEPVVPASLTKKKFMAMMEAYKRQNPIKYAKKEASLLAELEKIGE